MLTPSCGSKYECMMEHKISKTIASKKRLIKSVYNTKIKTKLFTCKEEYIF